MTEYLEPHFVRALCRDPDRRTLQVSSWFFTSTFYILSGFTCTRNILLTQSQKSGLYLQRPDGSTLFELCSLTTVELHISLISASKANFISKQISHQYGNLNLLCKFELNFHLRTTSAIVFSFLNSFDSHVDGWIFLLFFLFLLPLFTLFLCTALLRLSRSSCFCVLFFTT